jgi:hypothetical protein
VIGLGGEEGCGVNQPRNNADDVGIALTFTPRFG